MDKLRIEKETTILFADGKVVTFKPEETDFILFNRAFVINIVVSKK